jgi:hypothetical protein
VADADLPYEEWLRQGSTFGVAGRNARWWLGDWLRYGATRYGTKYTAAVRVTGYDRQTLMNLVYVATRFEISRRRENLSWSHHAELAAVDPQEQEHWLDRAITDKFSVRDLREELTSVRRTSGSASASSGRASRGLTNSRPDDSQSHSSTTAASHQTVTCPACGHEFVLTDDFLTFPMAAKRRHR